MKSLIKLVVVVIIAGFITSSSAGMTGALKITAWSQVANEITLTASDGKFYRITHIVLGLDGVKMFLSTVMFVCGHQKVVYLSYDVGLGTQYSPFLITSIQPGGL